MKPTKKQMKEYGQFVLKHALERKKTLGPVGKYSEVDFFAGAMCAYFFFEQPTEIPGIWIFNPMEGKAIT